MQYNVGDHVRIMDGPLASFTGIVEEIEPEKNRVSVMVSMFGRETPVDLELDQVEVMKLKSRAGAIRHRTSGRNRQVPPRTALSATTFMI